MQVSSLHTYPVKSGRVIDVETSIIDPLGLQYDRRWVIVQDTPDEDETAAKRFISQRTHPQLARLKAVPSKGKLLLSYDGNDYRLDLNAPTVMMPISVWKDEFEAAVYQDTINDWLSRYLGGAFRLASLSGAIRRRETEEQDAPFDVSFADGYPILITTRQSLNALNDYVKDQGEDDVPMSRFRPNIVIDGAQPWGEDSWARIKIGDVVIDCVKPCTRCIMTTLDPMSGESRGDITLQALTHLRRSADKRLKGLLFGMNAIPRNKGQISQGDKVEVLESREAWPVH